LTIDTLFPSLVQTLPLLLLYGPTTSSLVFSYLLSFQKHRFTYETFEEPIFWPLFQILLSPLLCSKYSILLPSFSLPLFSFFVFSSFFFLSPFSALSLFVSFLPLFFSFLFSVFAILTSSALVFASVFTAYNTSLGTLSSSPLLFSN